MNNKKKILVSIIFIGILIAIIYSGYKILAKSTNEMISEGDGLPANFPYITYEDLINEPDTLCCGRGIALIGASRTIVSTGDRSQSEPYLTMNDIGKKLFEETQNASGDVTSDNFSNPYSATTSRTYGYYVESDKKVATPEEAYILAEISENVPSAGSTFYNRTNEEYTEDISDAYFYNIYGTVIYGVDIDDKTGEPQKYVVQDEETGKYYYIEITDSGNFFPYTYVQYAWWRTPAGGSSSKVQSTAFSQEAKAFEAYINKVAKRDENGKIVTQEKTVTVNGKTATVTAPVIDYKISSESDDATVEYDKERERYLIGPFKINYYEESVTTERGTVNFSSIINATLITNLGEVDNSKWFFKYNNRSADDTATFPHNGEEFYIVLDYEENARFIADLKFDFKYMNAGGEYSELKGEYFNASWEPKSEAIWCDEGAKNCPCGGHHTSVQKDSNGNIICSGGAKKCSHGYYHNHIVKWNYWVELTDLTSNPSQPLAQVYVGARWYEDAEYHLNTEYKPDEPEELIKLTIPMEGEVWIDKNPDKKNPQYAYGTKEDGENGYKNAEVYIYKVIKDKSGNIVKRNLQDIYDKDNKTKLSYPIYTDENGHYEIPNINVPGTGDVNYLKENGYQVSYDVEFKYDGQHYEASTALPTAGGDPYKYISASKEEKVKYEKDSIASENAEERDAYNKKFTEVYGGNAMENNGDTTGYSTNGQDTLTLDYTSTEFSLPDNTNTRRLSTLTVLDKNEHIIDQYKMTATTGNTGVYYPVNNKISVTEADDVKELSVVENETGKTTTYKTIYNYMLHINLAVKEREKADLSVFKDLYKAEILVNEKEITKTYNKYVDVEDEENKEALEIQIEACKIGKYTIDLYSSDYEYRSTVYQTSEEAVRKIKADTDLKVYLTYRIAINNESQAEEDLIATINQINDYYDKTFTLVNSDINANVLDNNQDRVNKVVAEQPYYRIVKSDEVANYTYWSDGMNKFTCNDTNKQVNDDYKKLTITAFKDTKLSAGDQLEMFITFEVDQNGYKGTTDRPELLGEKNNVAEIANYSTYYTNGKVAGIIDRDSAPDNIDLTRNVKEWYEDDTESAPATNIQLYRYNREINGNVWEDSEAINLLYNQKVANGTMDEDEAKIKDIDVQIVEKIQIDGIEYEKIWTEDDFPDLTAEEKKEYRLKDVTTDENGYYYFKGILAGNYVVRFKYGNKEATVKYNGQDYKNTVYQVNMTNSDGTSTLDNEWQDLRTSTLNDARISDARDYELQRMKVIAYSKNIDNQIGTILESADKSGDHTKLIENTQMVANTAKLNIEIEHQDYVDYGIVNKVDGIQEYTYVVKNIDFGLERRSGTAIDLDKKISKISLYKEDGTELLLSVSYNEDGTINKEANSNKYVDKVVHLDETDTVQGFEYIPTESTYKNGTILKVEYKITVTNNSEVDWTGKLDSYETSESILNKVAELEKSAPYVSGEMITYGEYVGLNYYNNQNNDTDKIVTTKVEQIIDYIDNDASSDMDSNTLTENGSWTEATLEELESNKALAENVYTDKNGEKLLLDSKERAYITEGNKNVLISETEDYNPSAITKLVPTAASEDIGKSASGKIRVVLTKQLTEENSNNDLYNNIAEVLKYSNTVGRRDELAVPGNAQVGRGEFIAATGYDNGELVKDYEGAKEVTLEGETLHLNGERDTDAPNYVTLTEPTGISLREYKTRNNYKIIAIVGIVLVAGLVVIKRKFLNKKDDIKLLNE
ncbi:MAG: carboxypeptidase regulatory-like domain-containing protein [Clostridia bacterium]|nr:carboxypeptidase regulatory-like domain-containing protein [Clostridia bacterium]MBP3503470.1 carboxypeptidase regulatory-like domain-containing protein [Clostridia bacterium]